MLPPEKETGLPDRVVHILAYFLRNPHAADTLEGIARWRLLEEDAYRTVREADDAIAWLVERGFLRQESRATDRRARPLFRLNENHIADAQRLLRRSQTG